MNAVHSIGRGAAMALLWMSFAFAGACSSASSSNRTSGETRAPDSGAAPTATGISLPASPSASPAASSTPDADASIDDAATALEAAPLPMGIEAGPSTSGLVVHEWGTYTSVQASDGHTLGGVHHEDEALPTWVHRRNLNDPQNYYFEQLPEEPRQQLETPVLYFYAPSTQDVQVKVSFPQGIVGEWFPEATSYLPAIGGMTHVAQGSTVWNLTLDPAISPGSFNPVTPAEIWAPSRHVASTPVRLQGAPSAIGEREQFLFYRGLGTFVAPVTVTTYRDGTIRIHNGSSDDVGSVFLLFSGNAGGSFGSLGRLGAGGDISTTTAANAQLSTNDFVQKAQSGLYDALSATGLYADEARAMVDTWTRSWFGNPGLRILYLAPRTWTDAWIPTEVTPAPSAFVRTLVGRIEVMTPLEEADLVGQIQTASRAQTPVSIAPLGRFAESRLERAVELLTDPQAQALAETTRQAVHAAR
jgi:hypothetical protein